MMPRLENAENIELERDPGRRVARAWASLAVLLSLCTVACTSDASSTTADSNNARDDDDDDDETAADDDDGTGGDDNDDGDDDGSAAKDAGLDAGRLDGGARDAGRADAGASGDGGAGGVTDVRDASLDAGTGSVGTCTRESLTTVIDQYFEAMAEHDPSSLPVAASVKFTENGRVATLGEGLWTTAGAPAFKRKLLDSERCGSLTQAIIDEGGSEILVGVRLKLENQEITEVESYVVRSGLFFRPAGVKDDGGANWEGLLPAEERSTREELNAIADAYFDLFTDSSVMVPFAEMCQRFEGGLMPVDHCSDGIPGNTQITARRYPVADVEAGIAVGFVLFGGNLLDFHMFKVRNGEVTGIQALVGPSARSSGWE